MNISRFLPLVLAALLFTACSSVPDRLPSTVTNSYAIGIYNRAKNGDADAKYELSKMYRNGSYGFPRSVSRADDLVQDASNDYNPSAAAVYDMSLRFRQQGMHSQADRYFQEALSMGEPRALGIRQAVRDAERSRQEAEATRQREFHATHVTCYACGGTGGKKVEKIGKPVWKTHGVYSNGNRVGTKSEFVGWETEWVGCNTCKSSGYLPR